MKKQLEFYFFICLLVILSIAFFRLIILFWVPILLAVILAHYLQRPYHFLVERFKFPKPIASLCITIGVLILIVVPASLISLLLSLQVTQSYLVFSERWAVLYDLIENTNWNDLLNRYLPQSMSNTFEPLISNFDFKSNLIKLFDVTFKWFFQIIKQTFVNFSTLLIFFLLMLYLLYYFIIQGKYFVQRIKLLIPLPETEKDVFIKHCVQVTDATLIGTVFISVAEGIFGGILLGLLGLPSPLMLGIAMTILSLLPLLGTNTVFIPVGIYKLVMGDIASGLIILLLGTSVITISQNVIKPKLVGTRSGIVPWVVAITTLGGIAWLGLPGILIGPLISSLFMAMWKLFEIRYYSSKAESTLEKV